MWVIDNGVLLVMLPKVERDEGTFGVRDATHRLSEMNGTDIMKPRGEWLAMEEAGRGLSLRISMPSLTQDHVKAFLEEDEKTLVIEGQRDEESKFEGNGRRYTRCKLDLTNFSNTERTISMENGVFIITIPAK